jgi:hypothetical protein
VTPAQVPLAFRDWLLPRMQDSILATESNPVHRDGCMEGVELCRSLDTPEAFLAALKARYSREQELVRAYTDSDRDQAALDAYWFHRCATSQIEYVWTRFMLLWPGAFVAENMQTVSARAVQDVNAFVDHVQASRA